MKQELINDQNLNIVLAQKMVLLGKRIKSLRQYKELTQQYVAFTIGTDKCVISSIELGTRRNVTLYTLVKISSALEIDIEDLFYKL